MINTKKRVIFFVPEFPVPSQTFVEREIYELYKRHNISIFILTLKSVSSFNFVELNGLTTGMALTVKDVLIGLFTTSKNLLFCIKKCTDLKSLYLLVKSVGYAKIVRKFNADHIHVHFMSDPATIGMFVSLLLEIPFSISGHARDVFGPHTKKSLIKQKIKSAKFVTVCNEKAYATCVNIAAPKDKKKVHLIYHGVTVSGIQTSATVSDLTPKPFVLFVGRFVEKKGAKYFLEALSILKEQVHAVFIGYGPQYAELKEYCKLLGLDSIVTFLNDGRSMDNATVLEHVANASVFVLPSLDLANGDSDGIPNNILEAGLFSKPVVTTNAGSISEIITDGKTGLIVPQRDAKALAAALTKLLKDNSFARRLGTNLNALVTQNFDLEKNIVELERLLLI